MIRILNRVKQLDIKEILLWIIILTAPIANEQGFATIEIGFTVYPSYIFGLAAICFLIRDKLREKDLRFWGSPVDIPLLLFLLAISISVFQSHLVRDISSVPMRSTISVFAKNPFTRSISQVAAIVFMALIYYFIINVIREEKQLKRAIMVYFVAATISSAYGLLMYALVRSGASNIVSYFGAIAGNMPPVDLALERGIRVRALFIEPLMLGTYLVSVIPVIFVSCFTKKWLKYRWLIFIAFLLQLFTLILTISRGAWLGLSMAFIILFIVFIRKITVKNIGKIAILFLAAISIAFLIRHNSITRDIERLKNSTIIERIKKLTINQIETVKNLNYYVQISRENCSANVKAYKPMSGLEWSTMMRINDMVAGIYMAKDHPFLGVGWGNYIYHYLNYDPHLAGWWWMKWPETGNRPGTPVSPNLFVTILAESGIIGFSSFIFLLISLIWFCVKAIRRNYDNNYGLIISGFLSAIIGVIVSYQFFSTFYFTFVWVMFGLAMSAVNLSFNKNSKEEGVKNEI